MKSPERPLPRIAVVRAGGTIDSIGLDRLDLVSYANAGARLGPGELIGRVPEIAEIADVEEVTFRELASQSIQIPDLLELTQLIHQVFDDGADGVVVAHGTSTLEETAYFLHLALKRSGPVVVVGAVRPSSAMSSDGDRNLYNAVSIVRDPAARGMGVLVALNDTIYSARDVTKSATYRVEAFQARDLGPLGYSDNDGAVVFYHRPLRAHTVDTEFDLTGVMSLPRVDIVVSYLGADGEMIRAAMAAGAQGIVVAGSGEGCQTPAEIAALAAAAASGLIVVQSTRVGSGRAVPTVPLLRRGWAAADNLQPWKARILLALALTRTRDFAEIQRMFNDY